MPSDSSAAETLFFTGTRHLQAGESACAEACFRQALALAPDFAEALANLALVLERSGALAEAEACYRRAIALCPTASQVLVNFGVLLARGRRLSDAEKLYRQALQLAPESPATWSNLGVVLACTQREEEAECCYRLALAIAPEHAGARFNLSYILLRQGRFDEGWRCLEARQQREYDVLAAHFTCPRWHGEALSGKSLVFGFEAGHGDMIQFCRYATVLKARGATRISVVCHPGLKALFATLAGVDQVFSLHDDVPTAGWDFWTPPMSVPLHCRTRLDSIPAPVPYLAADPARVVRWQALLPANGPRVGLVWQGNRLFENDADRSLASLDLFAPLAAVAGVHFVSLQKGPGESEARRPPAGLALVALGESFADFADTAAVVASLDLVISVDTAVAHLAGALGIPCWVLLPDYRTDWRWLTGCDDSPWYPGTMRLFRQPPGGGWQPVIAAVVAALQDWRR